MKKLKPNNNRYRITLFLILLLFIFLAVDKGYAQKQDFTLEVSAELSLGEYIKGSRSIPVTVDVRNRGDNFEGSLHLIYRMNHRGNFDEVIKDINIPKFGNKRFFIYLPRTPGYVNPTARIKIMEKKNNREQPAYESTIQLRSLNDTDYLVPILNRQRGGYAYVGDFTTILPTSTKLTITYPSPGKLPLHWKGYDSANFVLINDLPSLNIDQAREEALLDYVRTGGVVVFSSNLDPNEFNNSIFKEYLPLVPTGTKTVEGLDEVFNKGAASVMEGEVKGEVLIKEGDTPILLGKKTGQGMILFLTANLSQKPFTADYEENRIWKTLIGKSSEQSQGTFELAINNFLDNIPESSLPLGLITWMLLFYFILIGPVNYFVLKKKDKLLYLFITIPVISLIFAFIIFGMGFSTKGSDIVQRGFSVTYLSWGDDSGKTEAIASIFSPKHATYQVTLANPLSTGWRYTADYNQPFVKLKEGENLEFLDQEIQMWNMRQYRIKNVLRMKGPISISVDETPGGITGRIVNNSKLTLNDCVLVSKGKISPVFQLRQGENQINYPTMRKLSSPNEFESYLETNYNVDQAREDKDPLIHARTQAIYNISRAVMTHTDSPVLIGWSRNELVKVNLDKKGSKNQSLNLFLIK